VLFDLKDVFMKLAFALPDVLAGAAFIFCVAARIAFGDEHSKKILPTLSVIMAVASFIVAVIPFSAEEFRSSLFVYNRGLSCIKAVLFGIVSILLIALNRAKAYRSLDSSIYFLIFGVVDSIMICLSSNSFLSLVVGLELFNYLICFLLLVEKEDATLRRTALRFMLISSATTAALMFGVSLYCVQFKSLSFSAFNLDNGLTSAVGTVFILIGLLFKFGAAPFHSWMVDIYKKASFTLVMFLDAVWKLFMAFIFTRVFSLIIQSGQTQYKLLLTIFSIMSMLIGGIMPIFQENIKKFVAYMSIGHAGFILSVFAAVGNVERFGAVVMSYLTAYSIASICFFSIVILLNGRKSIEKFKDLSGLIYNNPIFGLGMLIAMFANSGLPPFANFMAKLDIFKALVNSNDCLLLIVTLLYSALAILSTAKACRYLFRRRQAENFPAVQGKFVIALQIVAALLVFLYSDISAWFSAVLSVVV
jgi:NADH-quinone oxidoreductase subunit N